MTFCDIHASPTCMVLSHFHALMRFKDHTRITLQISFFVCLLFSCLMCPLLKTFLVYFCFLLCCLGCLPQSGVLYCNGNTYSSVLVSNLLIQADVCNQPINFIMFKEIRELLMLPVASFPTEIGNVTCFL